MLLNDILIYQSPDPSSCKLAKLTMLQCSIGADALPAAKLSDVYTATTLRWSLHMRTKSEYTSK